MTRILWADDQTEVVKSFAPILDETGAQISFVSNGEDAIKLIRAEHFDLVLLDLAMPPARWGGLWVLEQLKEIEFAPPVIVVSGEGMQAETIKALRLGAADYVTKEQMSVELPSQIVAVLKVANCASVLERLVFGGESSIVEFKSTLRVNLFTGKPDENMELSVLKTIAAFLNSDGGTLAIGLADDGLVVGVEQDKFSNNDKFQLHFWNLIRQAIGPEFSDFLTTTVLESAGKHVFLVECKKSNRPVYVKWKASGESKSTELFFVRSGPQTDSLSTRQAVHYIQDHFR